MITKIFKLNTIEYSAWNLTSPPVRSGAAGLLIGVEYSRVRDSTWIYLTLFVTTRLGVELVDVLGNYPTMM